MLSIDQLATIRDEIGDAETPDDYELDLIHTRKGMSLTKTVLSVIDKRIATLASGGPLSFTVVGEISINRGANLQALIEQRRRIMASGIGGETPMDGVVTIGSIRRTWAR